MRGTERPWKRALLVAEHDMFRHALALVLEWHGGFKAVQAGSLGEARRVLRDQNTEPDLAVVDLEVPNGSAVDLVGEIREVWPRIPVLALTTRQDPERATQAREAGAGEVLTLAASSEEILEEVRRLGNG